MAYFRGVAPKTGRREVCRGSLIATCGHFALRPSLGAHSRLLQLDKLLRAHATVFNAVTCITNCLCACAVLVMSKVVFLCKGTRGDVLPLLSIALMYQ